MRLRSGRNSHLCNDGNIITKGSEEILQQGLTESKTQAERASLDLWEYSEILKSIKSHFRQLKKFYVVLTMLTLRAVSYYD